MSHEVEKMIANLNKENEKYETDEVNEMSRKKDEISKAKVEFEHDKYIGRQKKASEVGKVNLDMSGRIKNLAKKNEEYFKQAAENKIFLNIPTLKGVIPYHSKNIILAGALSGAGKSTLCANTSFHALAQGQNALVITNEEATEDVYNRQACLFKGWHYVDHGKFTPEQVRFFNKNIEKISQRLTVISDDANERGYGATTTIEGMIGIFEAIKKSKKHYDVIIIDYYQGISSSVKNPELSNWQVQEEFVLFLDTWVKSYNAPVIILSQLKPQEADFKERIEGRKAVYNKATVAFEVKANREKSATDIIMHKGRFSEHTGKTFRIGYDRGKFVTYDDEFMQRKEMERVNKAGQTEVKEALEGVAVDE